MNQSFKKWIFVSGVGIAMASGCAFAHDTTNQNSAHAALPQLVRFYGVNQVKSKPGLLLITGSGSASADNGKTNFTAKGPLSSYPLIRMTIQSEHADELQACAQQLHAIRDTRQTIDIRGTGTFTIKSEVDPPLDTGILILSHLEACGLPQVAPSTIPAVSTSTTPDTREAVPASELVAVPEQFLDRPVVIKGLLSAPVHFAEPVSRVVLESEGQTITGYFITKRMPAPSRLALVHATPRSVVMVKGILVQITPTSLAVQAGASVSGYEFDLSDVFSIKPN